ncbi:nuclear transport factor 2 family protein [Phenylobacterium sp.]|uniref:nuclear transport factor 2 family protein n=1 Tax=Phenylobacterium sp. TaxID=1871053 RepID=UPI002F3F9FCA
MDETQAINRVRLATLTAAWAAGDAEAAAACFAPEGVYAASVGPQPGATFYGRREIRDGIATMLALDLGAPRVIDEPLFLNDRAITTWTYWKGAGDGLHAVRGCDLFTFSRGRILMKDAFRKTQVG